MKIHEKSLFLLLFFIIWSKSGIIKCNEANEIVTKEEVNQNKNESIDEDIVVNEEIGINPNKVVLESEEYETEIISTTLGFEIVNTTHSTTTTTTTIASTGIKNTSVTPKKKQNVYFDSNLNLYIYSEYKPAPEPDREPESLNTDVSGSTTQRIVKLIVEDVNNGKLTTTESILKDDDVFVDLSNADIQYPHVTEVPKINENKTDDFGKISQVKDKDKATDDKNDKKSNNTALIIIVAMSALAIVIIIAALIFYFSRRNYKKVPTTAIEDI